MSYLQTRKGKGYRYRTTVENTDNEGFEFAEWLTDRTVENYAYKIAQYCDTKKNCEECVFYNGTCRLNFRPYSWDMRSF